MRKLIFTLFIMMAFFAKAQDKGIIIEEDSLVFTGQVFDKESLEPLPKSIYMVNGRMFVSDDKGRFRFSANEGDTVVFHNVGYQDLILVVEESISNEEFLTGIFLSQKQYELSEVLVVPRNYDLETLVKTTPNSYEDIQIAEKNMKMSAYQGLMPNMNWDAETNQKYAIQKEIMRTEYKGMVAPDKMFGANLFTVIPETRLTYGTSKEKPIDMGAVSTSEEKYLQTVYDAIRQEKMKQQQDSIPQRVKPPLKQIK